MNRWSLLCALLLAASAARADEGMWTYDNFPSAKVGKKYGFTPDQKWLDEARLSSVRLAGGCSGSFVSPEGLVMTNHHCALSCIGQLSTKEKDFVAQGFYAPEQAQEVKCPEIELNQLLSITDVTKQVSTATKGLADKEANYARKKAVAAIEKGCANGDEKLRCEVVDLYRGGVQSLYKYKRFQDVRLVFAPEESIAFFGGDPDNFNFPRYDLDVSFIRAYENEKPARVEHYFKWAPQPVREGDLTNVSGNPGTNIRDETIAQLQVARDRGLPERLLMLAEYRGQLTEFAKSSPEHARISEGDLRRVENSYKALLGRFQALTTETLWTKLSAHEKELRAKLKAKPALQKEHGAAWEQLAKAVAEFTPRRFEYGYVEGSPRGAGAFNSRLYQIARTLVRGTEELPKPNDQRLKEFGDSKLPAVKQSLFSKAPIYDDLEVLELTFSLTKMRQDLGTDSAFVKKILGKKSPEDLAKELVAGSKLRDVELRQKLWADGKGKDSVRASDDAMIKLVLLTDPDARATRKWYEDSIEAPEKKASESIARARFALEGTKSYPDATFTLRLSYGAVKGWQEGDHFVKPLTEIAGAFDRATGREPFELPQSWIKASEEKRLNGTVPFNLASTNDIIGGNSGSPVFNKDLQITGLIFDGNIESLGGEYGFDESVNRAVVVTQSALVEALDHVYGAKRIVNELKPAGAPGAGQK